MALRLKEIDVEGVGSRISNALHEWHDQWSALKDISDESFGDWLKARWDDNGGGDTEGDCHNGPGNGAADWGLGSGSCFAWAASFDCDANAVASAQANASIDYSDGDSTSFEWTGSFVAQASASASQVDQGRTSDVEGATYQPSEQPEFDDEQDEEAGSAADETPDVEGPCELTDSNHREAYEGNDWHDNLPILCVPPDSLALDWNRDGEADLSIRFEEPNRLTFDWGNDSWEDHTIELPPLAISHIFSAWGCDFAT